MLQGFFKASVLGKSMSNSEEFNQPLGGNDMPRFAGPGTMMRLPSQPTAEGLDACFIGVPFDIGASNRSGTRFGASGDTCRIDHDSTL